MDKSCCVTLDANVCINYAVQGSHSRAIGCFIDGCFRESIEIGAFTTEIDHSYQNVTFAASQCYDKGGGGGYYKRQKSVDSATKKLQYLFSRIEEFKETWTRQEIDNATNFFAGLNKDLRQFLASGRIKKPIPEEHDIVYLICAVNLKRQSIDIVTNDYHFIAYSGEIMNQYQVRILALEELDMYNLSCGWN